VAPKDYPETAKPMPVSDEIVEKGVIASRTTDKIKMFLITSMFGMTAFFGDHVLAEFTKFSSEVIYQFKEINGALVDIRDDAARSRTESMVNSTKNSTRLDAHDAIFKVQDKRISSIEESQRSRQ